MQVKYLGATDAQVRWGGGSDPREYLNEGQVYTLRYAEVHSMHTRYHLVDFKGLWFNSVCFREVSNGE